MRKLLAGAVAAALLVSLLHRRAWPGRSERHTSNPTSETMANSTHPKPTRDPLTLVIACLAMAGTILNSIVNYYSNVYTHRNLFLTVTPRPLTISGSTGPAGEPLNLNPVIQNIGNYTEVIVGVSYNFGELHLAPAGPFVLKPGEAVAVRLSLPFDVLSWYARNVPPQTFRISVSVSLLDPDEKLFSKEIPVAEADLTGYVEQDHIGFVNFTERVSPDYQDGPVNLISSFSWFRGF